MGNNFKTLRDAGISVVRMWLMGDGTNYDGTAEFGHSKDRGLFWDFQPPEKVDQSFLDDFGTLLGICKSAGIQLIPVLIDFYFFDDPRGNIPAPGQGFVPTQLDYSRGRRSIASNLSFRKRFIEGTFEPLLKIAAENQQVIYAFDIMNEPWWCIAPITGSLFGRRLQKDDLVAFLIDCIDSIKKFHLKSTIGHRYLSDIFRTFSSVKVDLPQHHYYAQFEIDGLMGRLTRPKPAKILGEFGSITPREFDELKHRAESERDKARKQILERQVEDFKIQTNLWPGLGDADSDPEKILELRLRRAESQGYELAMIWPGPVDPDRITFDDLKLTPQKLRSVRRYTAPSTRG